MMNSTRLTGKEWLESQGVSYRAIKVDSAAPASTLVAVLKCKPSQFMVCDLYMGERAPVIVVHALGRKVDLSLLAKHVGDVIQRQGTEEDCVRENGLSLRDLHPFLENYAWKVLDEHIFENESVYIRAGNPNEILEVEANALKYVIGVVNGLLAEVTRA